MSLDTNHIEELFRSKLEDLESPVDSQLWQSIQAGMQTNVGATAAAAKTGLSGLTKGLIIATSVVGVGVATWFAVQSSDDKQIQNTVYVTENQDVNSDTTISEVVGSESVNTEDVLTIQEVKLHTSKLNLADVDVHKQVLIDGSGVASSIKPMEVVVQRATQTADSKEVAVPIVVTEAPNKNIDKVDVSASVQPTTVESSVDKTRNIQFNRLPNVYVLSNSGHFNIEYQGEFNDFSFTVLDQNQNAVFSTDDPDFKWYGEDNFGQKLSPGDYLYLIIGTDVNHNKIQKFQSLKVLP